MQTIASSSLTARPVAAGLRSCAPRPSLRHSHSNGVGQQQHLLQQRQQQQRGALTVSSVSLAEIQEIEDMDFEQQQAAGSSALPSGNVKVRPRTGAAAVAATQAHSQPSSIAAWGLLTVLRTS